MEPIPVMDTYASRSEVRSTFILKVYSWMTIGLFLTASVSAAIEFLVPGVRWMLLENPMIFYILLFLELGIVWGLSAAINRIPAVLGILIFFGYAALNGVTFSIIFMVYSLGSIFLTFMVCSMMFAGASVIGFVTKMDLTKVGGFLMMALIGLIIASIANIFLNSTNLEWIISYAGVIIFVGLTAWDTQKIKNWSTGIESGSEKETKLRLWVL